MILPADLPQNQTTGGLQTWPLKNRIISTDTVKKNQIVAPVTPIQQQQQATMPTTTTLNKTPTKTTIDEVVLEEKRLINALKNGDIVNESVMKSKEIEVVNNTKWGLRNTRQQQQVPHPELTTSQRQHLRQTATNPVRPFLTRGSVAERVLIFERCPSDLLRVRPTPTPSITKPQVLI